MKIRITEPVFFQGAQRRVGETIDVEVGPFRNRVIPGGLELIPQFVEMPEEIKQVLQEAVGATVGTNGAQQPVDPPAVVGPAAPIPGSFAQATASILKPPAPKPAGLSPAAQLAALTTRRRKLTDSVVGEISAYGKRLEEMETKVPQVFTKANTRLDDEQANLTDLDNSLNDFLGANGGDPLQP